jgi:hypothetical protein
VSVLAWMETIRRGFGEVRRPPVRRAPPSTKTMTGPYVLLWDYLEHRHANTVVLTFGEIEDLLGFSLPDQASRQREWWTDAAASEHSDAWMLASRSALPNLLARTVVFERAA